MDTISVKTPYKTKVKDLSIETLRGVAILLVVAGYIIHDDLGRNGESLFTSILNFAYYWFTPIRIPLFTVISAYLYGFSPATLGTFKKLVTGKARRILIPFAVVSALQYTFFWLVPVSGPHPIEKIYTVYLYPFDQLWFLYSIFLIFVIVGFLDVMHALSTPKRWAACVAVSLVLYASFVPTRLLSLHGVTYLLPFFLLGYGIKRFSKVLFTPRMVTAYLVTASLAYSFYFLLYVRPLPEGRWSESFYKVVGLFISFSAVPLIFHFRRAVPVLAKVGSYAFCIHLFNKISYGLPKWLCQHFAVKDDAVIFVVLLVSGVAISVVIQHVLEHFAFTRKFVLGLKHAPKKVVTIPVAPVMRPVRPMQAE